MKSHISTISPTSRLIVFGFSQLLGTSLIGATGGYITVGSTTSLVYESLYTGIYTVDTYRSSIVVSNILFEIVTDNDANGECKAQISGDGGNTFVDMTGDIGTGAGTNTGGVGIWINSIDIGENMLQFRLLGRSTDGLAANIKVQLGYTTGNITIHKHS